MRDLSGKVALVTGASRGIGAATAICLAKYGAHVVLAARTQKDIEEKTTKIRRGGGKASSIVCDVSRYADVEAAIKFCISEYGRLDILVNNAGTIEPIARIADSDPQAWSRVIDINFKSVYYGLRAAIPIMEAQGAGVIVNISSGAVNSALEGWSHYCASKAGAFKLTQCAHKEVGDKGICVIGLSPGTVSTHIMDAVKTSGINPVSKLAPSVHISPEQVAEAIAFLCTPEASEYAGTDFSIKTEEGRKRAGLV